MSIPGLRFAKPPEDAFAGRLPWFREDRATGVIKDTDIGSASVIMLVEDRSRLGLNSVPNL